jgi:hypothetical protein
MWHNTKLFNKVRYHYVRNNSFDDSQLKCQLITLKNKVTQHGVECRLIRCMIN